MIMLGGSPTGVVVPPMLACTVIAIKIGTGFMSITSQSLSRQIERLFKRFSITSLQSLLPYCDGSHQQHGCYVVQKRRDQYRTQTEAVYKTPYFAICYLNTKKSRIYDYKILFLYIVLQLPHLVDVHGQIIEDTRLSEDRHQNHHREQ